MPLVTEDYLNALKTNALRLLPWNISKIARIAFDRAYPGEIAGLSAVLTAAELLSIPNHGRGVLLGGIAGIPPAKVLILGAGVVGEFATKAMLWSRCQCMSLR